MFFDEMMMAYFLTFIALFLALIGTLIIVILGSIGTYLFFAGKFMRFSPPVPSSGRTKKAMLQDAATFLETRKNLTVVDLGSGWGTLLLPLAKKFPQHQFVGYELAKLPYFISRWRGRKSANLQFRRQDFFAADLSEANVVFCFLLPAAMQQCQEKIVPQLPKGAVLYANRFALPNITPMRTESLGSAYETYYVYRF